jgi:hypothetical protein
MGRAQGALQKRVLGLYHYLADVLPYMILSWDERYLRFVGANRFLKKLSPAMVIATYFGDGYLWGLVGLFILIWGTPLDRKYVMIAFAITMINIALFRFLKFVFKRTRPLYTAPPYDLGYRLLDTYSFPSGQRRRRLGSPMPWRTSIPIFISRSRPTAQRASSRSRGFTWPSTTPRT